MERIWNEQDARRINLAGIREAIAVLCVLISVGVPARATETAFVRVNQLGYETGTASRAYLMSPSPESGAIFHVVDSHGVQVLSRRVSAQHGTWGTFRVYALDFKVSAAD